jgi:hypothetical protein
MSFGKKIRRSRDEEGEEEERNENQQINNNKKVLWHLFDTPNRFLSLREPVL